MTSYFIKRLLFICFLPLMLTMCMRIENIIHPDNAQVNSNISIRVDLKLEPANDDNTPLIFAILAPESWNLIENSTLLLTTKGYTKGDVSNEILRITRDNEIEPITKLPWSQALSNELGMMGNLKGVKWYVFESQTVFDISDETETLINATVNIQLKTGSENLKVSMGYFFCGKHHGFEQNMYKSNARSKVLRITGGANQLIDYTNDKISIDGEPDDQKVYTFVNAASAYYLGVSGNQSFNEKFKDVMPVCQQEIALNKESLPEKWLRWIIIPESTDGGIKYCRLMNAMSGKYLTAPQVESPDGATVFQQATSVELKKDYQLWSIHEVMSGNYKISNKATGLVISPDGMDENAILKLRTFDDSENRLWKLFSYEPCSYRDDNVVRFFERNDKTQGSSAFDQGSSIPLSNGKVLWITQDSWDGAQLTSQSMFGSTDFFRYGNSMFLQPTADNWNSKAAYNISRLNSAQNKPRQICDIQPNQSFAWPANGVELNGRVYLHCGEGNGLTLEGQSIYEIWPIQTYQWASVRHCIESICHYDKISYAAGMIKSNDNYVYIYGTRVNILNFNLYVARFSQDNPMNSWSFWNGSQWVSNPPSNDDELASASIFSGIGASVAVSEVNGKFLIVSLDQGFWVTEDHYIRAAVSDSPIGKFSIQIPVYEIQENIYGTQAKYYSPNIHPASLNGRNELLVTYSLNYNADQKQDISCNSVGHKIVSGDTIRNGAYIDPYFYRVKGVRIPYSLLSIPNDMPNALDQIHGDNTHLYLFPNPVQEELYLSGNNSMYEQVSVNVQENGIGQHNFNGQNYVIYDLKGSIIKYGMIQKNRIAVQDLSDGHYFIRTGNALNPRMGSFIKLQ